MITNRNCYGVANQLLLPEADNFTRCICKIQSTIDATVDILIFHQNAALLVQLDISISKDLNAHGSYFGNVATIEYEGVGGKIL